MDRDRQHQIDNALADMFFGCNFPFVAIESPHFQKFVHLLNPEYTIPAKDKLRNSLLNARFNAFVESVMEVRIRDAELLIDGWKNKACNKKYVVAMVLLADGRYTFLDAWDFSIISETGIALSDIVDQCIGLARDRYNLNIYAIITDNASNMMLMGRLTYLWHTTCSSHSGNLLCESMADQEFTRTVKRILKEFKSTNLENLLVGLGGSRIILPGKTRFASYRDSFRCCLNNLDHMRTLATQPNSIVSPETRALIETQDFEARLIDNLLILDPICEVINRCQALDCSLAEGVELWFSINVPVENFAYQRMIDARIRKAINGYGLAANFLHHRYRGIRFSRIPFYVNMLNRFFESHLTEEGLVQLEHYRNGTGHFQMLFQRNFESTTLFWRTASIYYPELGELAIKLLNLCASTGQLERLFSKWSHVHSLKRNRLRPDRSAKLVTLYYDLNMRGSFLLEEDSDEEV